MNNKSILRIVLVSSLVLSSLGKQAMAEPEKARGGWQEGKHHRYQSDKDLAAMEAQRAKWLQLESQLAQLKSEELSASDEASKKQIHDKMKPLLEQKADLMEQMAKEEVEAAKRRLEQAEKFLTEIQSRKTQMLAEK